MDQYRNKKEFKDFLKFNENKSVVHPNMWDRMKVVLRGTAQH